jgi:ribosomal protein RSM22 (predicted rRNA methylase)
MELPPALRDAVDRALAGVPAAELARAAATLSQRYRTETRDGRQHVADDLAAQAYLATRLPATYAATRAAMAAVAEVRPEFAPRTMLDAGAGPGTALWAAADCWDELADATLVESSAAMRRFGERLAAEAPVANIAWLAGDVARRIEISTPADLVALAYVLDELAPAELEKLVLRLWELTADTLLIVEPGTPAGWSRILKARDVLLGAGAYIIAPCPHAKACPLEPPDWCHFARRVARSRVHRVAKGGEVPWEDEKYIYLAVSRVAAKPLQARVIAPPHQASGRVTLKLCRADGSAGERMFSRRDGEDYKMARRAGWGEAL